MNLKKLKAFVVYVLISELIDARRFLFIRRFFVHLDWVRWLVQEALVIQNAVT